MRVYKDPTFVCECGAEVTRASPNQKRCPGCRVKKNNEHRDNYRTTNRERVNATHREKYAENKDTIAAQRKARREERGEEYLEYHRQWRARNREKMRWQAKARKYNVTIEFLKALYDEQGGDCPVCTMPLDDTMHVDHCHETGRVRGLLHGNCNRGLGMFGDDPELLMSGAQYLLRALDQQPAA